MEELLMESKKRRNQLSLRSSPKRVKPEVMEAWNENDNNNDTIAVMRKYSPFLGNDYTTFDYTNDSSAFAGLKTGIDFRDRLHSRPYEPVSYSIDKGPTAKTRLSDQTYLEKLRKSFNKKRRDNSSQGLNFERIDQYKPTVPIHRNFHQPTKNIRNSFFQTSNLGRGRLAYNPFLTRGNSSLNFSTVLGSTPKGGFFTKGRRKSIGFGKRLDLNSSGALERDRQRRKQGAHGRSRYYY